MVTMGKKRSKPASFVTTGLPGSGAIGVSTKLVCFERVHVPIDRWLFENNAMRLIGAMPIYPRRKTAVTPTLK